ncbi:MAG: S41 family peptidase [Bacteroidetes bacterium]|uniref:S41 family peptidase n=1 Tax=Candidatus Egerieousia excrementavium TaxID=2840778 RepID=A0A9D9DLI7_9BACT|nr:S41 family peptidase [Candidatus Egerieousia excrementavium]
MARSLEIQNNILKELVNGFVDSVSVEKLVNTGINAMLGSLDPYTEYIPEEDEKNIELLTTATYGGIGAMIKKLDTTGVIISQPYLGSPAVKYGLEPGDVILEIDGEDVMPLNAEECSSRMKGEPGTSVRFLVRKGRSGKTAEIEVVRERIHIPDVSYSGILKDTIGYIKIDGFTVNGSEDVRKAVVSLKEKGARRLILDLRGNGGGLLDEAVDIVSLFVPKGTLVVTQKGRANVGADMEYRTKKEPVDTLIPLMVLVNSGSASSSEIVTGAIQDLDRGYVAGTRTYGKGLVQAIRPVGYNGTMKMTIAKYYTPSGRCVQAIDYSHRNSDGSVGYVPDSLKKAFRTRLGRTVYDGGGITPDSVIASDQYSRIAISLVMNDIINDYAIKFYSEHDSIPPVMDFSLTDEQYGDFVKYAVSREFDSRSGAQVLMEDLLKSARQEELDEYIKAEAEALKAKLSISKEQMLLLKKEEIRPLVEEEIANKYYFTPGRVEAIIKSDSQLHKAVALFAGE